MVNNLFHRLLLNNVQVYLKHCRSRFYISRVIAYFVSNFVAMATRVGRGSICVTLLNSPTPKTRVGRKYLLYISYRLTSRVIAAFVSNFVAMATGIGRSRICQASFNSPIPKPPVILNDLGDISYIS